MKTTKKHIILLVLSIFAMNCSRNDDGTDESYLFDQDEDCVFGISTCCDIDGRILVESNSTYTYTNLTSFTFSTMEWEVLSGDITLTGGQNTNNATFNFGSTFSTGKISASTTGINGDFCVNILEIKKLDL
jgi:hypothetical protein